MSFIYSFHNSGAHPYEITLFYCNFYVSALYFKINTLKIYYKNNNIMTLILQVFYSIFSGVILSAAIPNEIYKFGEPLLSFIALVPFYITIRYFCKNYRQAFWCTFIQVLTTHLISSFWLAYFKDFAIFTLGASALGTALIGACMGILFYLPYL